jgi:hypothetical protein
VYRAIPNFGGNCESFTVIEQLHGIVYHVSVISGKIRDILVWDSCSNLWYCPSWNDRDPNYGMRHGIATAVYKILDLP